MGFGEFAAVEMGWRLSTPLTGEPGEYRAAFLMAMHGVVEG